MFWKMKITPIGEIIMLFSLREKFSFRRFSDFLIRLVGLVLRLTPILYGFSFTLEQLGIVEPGYTFGEEIYTLSGRSFIGFFLFVIGFLSALYISGCVISWKVNYSPYYQDMITKMDEEFRKDLNSLKNVIRNIY